MEKLGCGKRGIAHGKALFSQWVSGYFPALLALRSFLLPLRGKRPLSAALPPGDKSGPGRDGILCLTMVLSGLLCGHSVQRNGGYGNGNRLDYERPASWKARRDRAALRFVDAWRAIWRGRSRQQSFGPPRGSHGQSDRQTVGESSCRRRYVSLISNGRKGRERRSDAALFVCADCSTLNNRHSDRL